MKYIYLSIKIINGDYEFKDDSVHEIKKSQKISTFCRKYISNYYGGKHRIDDEVYFFDNAAVAVSIKTSYEISKEDYDVLKKYL